MFLAGLLPRLCARALAETITNNVALVRPTQEREVAISLEEGKPIERELFGGQSHSYQLKIVSGQYVSLIIEQKGIDVVVRLFAPDGKLLVEVDSPNGTQGPEPVRAIADATGDYRLEVSSLAKDARPGRYEAKLVELRLPTQQDRDRLAARRIFDEGVRLHTQATRDSVETALKKYGEALSLYQATGDRDQQFSILFNMSGAYRFIGEPQKAPAYLNQALQIALALQDKRGQFTSLINMGDVYRIVGEPQKAVVYLNQALEIARALGDKNGQVLSLRLTASAYRTLGELEKALQAGADDPPIARVAVMSGALLADSLAALHAKKAAARSATTTALPAVLVSQGRADPVLPFARGASIESVLRASGYPITFYPFEGGHEIPAALVERLRQFLLRGSR